MIDRRKLLVGTSAVLICAPSIVRAASIMQVRSFVVPAEKHHYGFVQRLYVDGLYRSGKLQGRALQYWREQGVLNHICGPFPAR